MIIHRSPLADVEIPQTTITAHVLHRTAEFPDRVAMIDGPSGRCYTYAQLGEMIHRFAGGLAARGFGKGDVLGLMAPNLPAAELEALLVAHPLVAEFAVIGVPDDEAGEIPLSLDEIQASVSGHVASYKQIRIVAFVDEIPKSPSGTILRRMLRDR
jgi:acyl-CoA synthetase (AMP-forming)/AMP-acid ligase II